MSSISLVWIGDLDQDRHKLSNYPQVPEERYRPKKIQLKADQKEVKIGRINSKSPPDYPIESCINNRMISRNHATIERLTKGGFMLYDHSMNGTYVNYIRVTGGVSLKQGDIVCFGHLNGANLKPGEQVSPFFSDLKYKVEVGSQGDSKRKRRPSQQGSVASSCFSGDSDNSDASEQSGRRGKGSPRKSKRDADESRSRKSLNGSVQKPRKRKATESTSALGSKSSKASKKERVSSQPSAQEFHTDVEQCSARPCKNPQDAAIDWISCDECLNWYHQVCIDCSPIEAKSKVYYCPYCK